MQVQNSLIVNPSKDQLIEESIGLLKKLIATPSLSKEEEITANIIENHLVSKGIKTHRLKNNIWAFNHYFDPSKPTILLNSHHDTVPPNRGYTLNPFEAIVKEDKLYGLGSNDAGGALVALLATFIWFHPLKNLNYNFIFVASAEEEISGFNGIELVLPNLPEINFAIVGEPTKMHLAVAEKGLLVIDCKSVGEAGHAAREEGDNAIYNAIKDITWFKTYKFPKVSASLGEIKMSVTVINAGKQHNMIPDQCEFTVDIRTTDAYTNSEVLEIIKQYVNCAVKPRSLRLSPSFIGINHPIVVSGRLLERETYGSPTTSDQALMNFPSIKLGPGDSARSHSADEFIFLSEIKEGINLYIAILSNIVG